jgi:hypothetical protein
MEDADAIAEMIRKKPGYVVEICGLYVSKMKDGRYHVVSERNKDTVEKIFESGLQAAKFFCKHRESLKLGYDFEAKEERSEVYLG